MELADITAGDTVAITMTKGDSTWVLPNNGDAKAAAKAITGTVSGNTLTTSEKALFGWKVVKGADSSSWSRRHRQVPVFHQQQQRHPPGYRRKPRLGGGHGVRLSEERGTVPLCGRVQQPGLAQLHFCPRQYRRADPGLLEAQHRPARQSGIVTDLTTLQGTATRWWCSTPPTKRLCPPCTTASITRAWMWS